MHPIFMLLLRRPDLVATHVSNYAELVMSEFGRLASSLISRLACAAAAAAALLLALGLTGVAAMLGVLDGEFHWVLAAVPGLAWLLTLVLTIIATRPPVKPALTDIKRQADQDLRILRLVKKAKND